MQFDDVYGLIESLLDAKTDEPVLDAMRTVARDNGYSHFIISGLPPRGVNVEPFVLAADWPAEWFARYFGRDYTQFDPVARNCFTTTLPFFWNEAPYDHESDTYAQRVMDEASDIGLKAGFCVPVHTQDGVEGCVSFGGAEQDLNPETRLSMHLISIYAHGALRKLRRPTLVNAPSLTERQKEVLKWVAQGKSYGDVGEVMDISRRTVIEHMQLAQKALGTTNGVHTLAEAIRYGLIIL